MKTIGIVAVTAEGAAVCYREVVALAVARLGDNRHPEVLLDNPQFADILAAQKDRDWTTVAGILSGAANKLAVAGADFVVVPANSVHYAYDEMARASRVPILNLVELAADECQEQGLERVAVMGVGITMSGGLYDSALEPRGIEQVRLSEAEAAELNRLIYDELVRGIVSDAARQVVGRIARRLKRDGCDGLILACTELPMILDSEAAALPCIDTTRLLARCAVEYSLA